MKNSATGVKAPTIKRHPIPRKPRGLTIRQQRFCEFIVQGMSGMDAYRQAGAKVSPSVAKACACKWLTKAYLQTRIAELRKPQTKKCLLTKDNHREALKEIVTDSRSGPMTKIRAIEVDAKLAGYFAPERIEVDDGPKRIESIRERAAFVVSALNRSAELRRQSMPTPDRNGNGKSNGNGNGAKYAGLNRWNA